MISAWLLLAQAAAQPLAPSPAAPAPAPWTPVERPGQAPGTGPLSAAATMPAGRLVVRCDRAGSPVVSVQFIPTGGLRGFGQQPVSLQFDDGTPLIDNWELMGAGAIEREEHAVATLTFGIAHARTVRLRSTDRAGAPVDVTFPGPPAEAPIRRVLAACGRPLAPSVAPAASVPAAPAPPDS